LALWGLALELLVGRRLALELLVLRRPALELLLVLLVLLGVHPWSGVPLLAQGRGQAEQQQLGGHPGAPPLWKSSYLHNLQVEICSDVIW